MQLDEVGAVVRPPALQRKPALVAMERWVKARVKQPVKDRLLLQLERAKV